MRMRACYCPNIPHPLPYPHYYTPKSCTIKLVSCPACSNKHAPGKHFIVLFINFLFRSILMCNRNISFPLTSKTKIKLILFHITVLSTMICSHVDCSGGFRGAHPARAPPTAQNFLNFMQFFTKFGKNHMLAPPLGGLAPPPTGNPGSA